MLENRYTWYSKLAIQFVNRIQMNRYLIEFHWSSVKEFFCLNAIDFVLEACLKFWPLYMKSISVPVYNTMEFLITAVEIEAICHDSSLNRRRMN